MFFLENMVAFKIRKAKALFKMMDCFMQGQSDLRYYYLKKRSSAGATAKLLFSSSIIQETIKSRLRGARPCYTSTVYSCVFYCSTRWGCVTTFTIAKLGRFFFTQDHNVWKLLKMSHLNLGNFGIFHQFFVLLKRTCLVTLFDRRLQVFKNSPKWTIFGIFN